MKKTTIRKIIAVVITAATLICLASCGSTVKDPDPGNTGKQGGETPVAKLSADLMENVTASAVNARAADDGFIASQSRLAVELFRKTAEKSKEDGDNLLISPLSIQLALAMTANGAKGKTLDEMAALLGGKLTTDALNEYLHTYVSSLPSSEKSKLEIANSIWFRGDGSLSVEPGFLQKNADYYGAQAYKEPFDAGTADKINDWVGKHTDGMIKKIVDEIDPSVMLYLINAVCFDAEWERVHEDTAVHSAEFTTESGTKKTVDMMYSTEHSYLNDGNAEGFVKYYKGRDYAFAALMPNEGIDIYDYIAGLTGDGLIKTLSDAENVTTYAALPKFKYEYETSLVKTLEELGMPTAFDSDKADLSGIGRYADGNLFIGNVLHKTFIEVDQRGTRAGAVTSIEVCGSAMILDYRTVTLDRPFVYMLIDCSTNLPVFIGAVTDIGE